VQPAPASALLYQGADGKAVAVSTANPLPVTGGGGGGGGGAVTVADGADVTQGAKADAASIDGSGSPSVVSLLKGMFASLRAILTALSDGTQRIQGNIADYVADAGGSVKAGGVYALTPTAATAVGQRVPFWTSIRGAMMIGAGPAGGISDNAASAAALVTDAGGTARPLGIMSYLVSPGAGTFRATGDATSAFVKAPPLAATNRSIVATTTAQTAMAANTARTKFIVKNDTTIDVWISIGGTASAAAGGNNIKVPANGGYLEMTGTNQAVTIIATSTTAAITILEW
jgi:hypothetical protein